MRVTVDHPRSPPALRVQACGCTYTETQLEHPQWVLYSGNMCEDHYFDSHNPEPDTE